MKTKKEVITEYAQRFGLPESQVDESIIPILLVLDEMKTTNKVLVDKIKGSIVTEQHIYYSPLSAWFGMSAKYFFPSIMMMFLGFLVYCDIQTQRANDLELRHANKLIFRVNQLKKENYKIYNKYFN